MMHIPEGFAVVTPYIFANNADAYVRFLKAAFGAYEIGRSTAADGRIANCQLRFGTTAIMVSEASEQFPASSAALYLFVADADAAMASPKPQALVRSWTCPTCIMETGKAASAIRPEISGGCLNA